MQPLGRRPSRFPSKTDHHLGKGYVNWWEVEIANDENKALDKREADKEIQQELYNMEIE